MNPYQRRATYETTTVYPVPEFEYPRSIWGTISVSAITVFFLALVFYGLYQYGMTMGLFSLSVPAPACGGDISPFGEFSERQQIQTSAHIIALDGIVPVLYEYPNAGGRVSVKVGTQVNTYYRLPIDRVEWYCISISGTDMWGWMSPETLQFLGDTVPNHLHGKPPP